MNHVKKDLLQVIIIVTIFLALMVGLWWYDTQTAVLDQVARQLLGA